MITLEDTCLLVTVDIRKEATLTDGFYLEEGSTIEDLIKEFNTYTQEPFTFIDCIINNREELVTDTSYVLKNRNKLEMTLKSYQGRLKIATFHVYRQSRGDSKYPLKLKSLIYGAK